MALCVCVQANVFIYTHTCLRFTHVERGQTSARLLSRAKAARRAVPTVIPSSGPWGPGGERHLGICPASVLSIMRCRPANGPGAGRALARSQDLLRGGRAGGGERPARGRATSLRYQDGTAQPNPTQHNTRRHDTTRHDTTRHKMCAQTRCMTSTSKGPDPRKGTTDNILQTTHTHNLRRVWQSPTRAHPKFGRAIPRYGQHRPESRETAPKCGRAQTQTQAEPNPTLVEPGQATHVVEHVETALSVAEPNPNQVGPTPNLAEPYPGGSRTPLTS